MKLATIALGANFAMKVMRGFYTFAERAKKTRFSLHVISNV